MIIGNFTYAKARDTYAGWIDTLTASVQGVNFRPTGKHDGKTPDYRVEVQTPGGAAELGAAWKRTGESGDYLSVKLDDPALAQPVNCALVASEGQGFILVWSRDGGSRKAKAA